MRETWHAYVLAGVLGAAIGVCILFAFRDLILPPPAVPPPPPPAVSPSVADMPDLPIAPVATVAAKQPTASPPATVPTRTTRAGAQRPIIRDLTGVRTLKDPKSGARQLLVDPFPEEGPPKYPKDRK